MIRFVTFILTFLIGVLTTNAQVTGTVLDAESKNGIPYATIRVDDIELITNEEGKFSVSAEHSKDDTILTISYIGYNSKQTTIAELKSNNNQVYLNIGSFEISEIRVSNVKPDPIEVMKNVKQNLTKNFATQDNQSKIFIRKTNNFKPKVMDVEIKKSTGFSKNELKSVNNDIAKIIKAYTNQTTNEYTDKLIKLHSAKSTKDGKPILLQKIEVIKATQLLDLSKSTNFDEIQKNITNNLTKHLDTTKFYRIKSGLFGTRDTISLSKSYNEKKKNTKKTDSLNKEINSKIAYEKGNLNAFINEVSFKNVTDFNFINDLDAYKYSFSEISFIDDKIVYVIDFQPKKSKAKFSGKLYINEADYAIIRTDFSIVEGKSLDGINLKLLLGIKFRKNHSKGTIQFKENKNSNTYYLSYASIEEGNYFYVNRPVRFIELAEKNRDELAFDIKIEGNSFEKTEYLNLEYLPSTFEKVKQITENEFKVQKISKYDSSIWSGYNIIEPIQEMKKFEAPN